MMAEETSANKDFKIRPMLEADIERCLEIWRKVNLTEGIQTVATSLAMDPDGFQVAEMENTGE